jgi:hypothetical protein
MEKLAQTRLPARSGRSPVLYGRVPRAFHDRIAKAAEKSGRSMSEELAALAVDGFEYRDNFGDGEARRKATWLSTTFIRAGKAAAQAKGISTERWADDPDCVQSATVRLFELALALFVPDLENQGLCLRAVKDRLALPLFNPRLKGGAQ